MKRTVLDWYEEHLRRLQYIETMDPEVCFDAGDFHIALLMIKDGISSLQAYCLACDGVMVMLTNDQ